MKPRVRQIDKHCSRMDIHAPHVWSIRGHRYEHDWPYYTPSLPAGTFQYFCSGVVIHEGGFRHDH